MTKQFYRWMSVQPPLGWRSTPRTFVVTTAIFLALSLLPAGATGQAWPVWKVVPVVRVDGKAQDLSPITFLQVGRTGAIAIGQGEDARVRLFSPAGQPVAEVGRSGSGPGEFRNIFFRAGWLTDSLWVFDRGLFRASVITPGGHVSRTIKVPTGFVDNRTVADEQRVSHGFFGWLGNGDTIFMSGSRFDAAKTLHYVIMSGSLAGDLRHIVVDFPLRDDCAEVSSNAFCAASKWAPSPDGSRLAVVSSALAQQRKGVFVATLVTDRGDTVYSRQFVVPTARITAADITAHKLQPPELPFVRTFERLPPMTDVVIGWDGTMWIGRDDTAGRNYVVLDPAGRPIGSVRLKPHVVIQAADRNGIWTIEEDADGVQSVVKYRVERGR